MQSVIVPFAAFVVLKDKAMTDGNKQKRRNWWRRLAATGTTEIELTDFHKAAHDGNAEEIKRLLESASVDINHRCHGKTALEMAIISKKVPAALLLIKKGASLYFEHGRNALCAASFHGLKEVAQAATNKGIDVNEAFCWQNPPMPYAIKTYPIQYAVQSGDADTVAYLLNQGANLNWFEVYPFSADGEVLSNDPFSVAWKERRYDIFLLLLDATLTYKSQKRRLARCGLLSPLEETEPRERLAERLAPWLEILDWESFDPSGGSRGLGMVIFETLSMIFGVGMYVHGDRELVELLIQKKAPVPEDIHKYLKCWWCAIRDKPDGLATLLECRPTVLEIAFVALPNIERNFDKDCWLFRGLEALSKKGLPFTIENIGRESLTCSLLQETFPPAPTKMDLMAKGLSQKNLLQKNLDLNRDD